jgi:nicotinate (nicotinamide) nucleotide adenylyltransferase
MRIGICGGTFDPFHRGHLDPVLAAREELQWDRVLYIPAWRQPFKTHLDAASGAHRFAMAALAIRDYDMLYVSPIELDRGGISYSVDTLDELHRQYPGAAFDWIIGDDNVADLDRWKDPERLFQLARFVVLSRSGVGGRGSGVGDDGSSHAPTADNRQPTTDNLRTRVGAATDGPSPSPTPDSRLPTPAKPNLLFAHNPTVPISSTEIRRRVRAGEPIDAFVDPLVSRYIHHYGLYKEGQP